MDIKQNLLGEILVNKGLISQETLNACLKEQERTKEFLGEILSKNNYIKEIELLQALSEQFHIPLFSLRDKYIDWLLVKQFSPSLVLDHRCIPIQKDDRSITIGISNPLDVWALKKAEEGAMGLKLRFVLLSKEDIEEAIRRYKEYIRGSMNKLLK